jgi:hypothetical protein
MVNEREKSRRNQAVVRRRRGDSADDAAGQPGDESETASADRRLTHSAIWAATSGALSIRSASNRLMRSRFGQAF